MNIPKTNPVRRNSRVGPLMLPASGRSGPAPRWPLPGKVDPFELAAWTQLWTTPQSVAWENLGWTRTVARYCRVMVAAERPDATGTVLTQATMMEDRLGLTPRAMRMLLWQIAPDEVTEKRDEHAAGSARERMKAV